MSIKATAAIVLQNLSLFWSPDIGKSTKYLKFQLCHQAKRKINQPIVQCFLKNSLLCRFRLVKIIKFNLRIVLCQRASFLLEMVVLQPRCQTHYQNHLMQRSVFFFQNLKENMQFCLDLLLQFPHSKPCSIGTHNKTVQTLPILGIHTIAPSFVPYSIQLYLIARYTFKAHCRPSRPK